MKKLLFLSALLLGSFLSLNSQIVITEIMYNPPESGTDSTEFIELQNVTDSTVDLTGYYFSLGVTYTFPNVSVPAGGFYVVTVDSSGFVNTFGFNANGVWSGGLSNGGEAIVLKDSSDNTIDSVSYDDIAPWPVLADGSGYSIQLCDSSADNTDGNNWGVSEDSLNFINGYTVYGTPGSRSNCTTLAGPVYNLISIDSANTINANGEAVLFRELVELRGVVNCIDFAESTGYEFFFANGQAQGISARSFVDISGYVVNSGDSLHLKGEIDQYNGLLQIIIDSLQVISSGNTTQLPTVVTSLDETTESRYVTLQNVYIVDTSAWSTSGSFNVEITDGGSDTSTLRIDAAANFSGMPVPLGTFNVSGWGGQFDNNGIPLDSGYQILPCSPNDLVPVTTALEQLDGAIITMYPNPTSGMVNIYADKDIKTVTIYNSLGAIVYSIQANNSQMTVDLSELKNGTYYTVLSGTDFQLTKSLVITK